MIKLIKPSGQHVYEKGYTAGRRRRRRGILERAITEVMLIIPTLGSKERYQIYAEVCDIMYAYMVLFAMFGLVIGFAVGVIV